MEMSMNERIRYYSAEKLEYGDFQNHASADTISCDQGKANSPRKGMTVKEMGDLLGLKKQSGTGWCIKMYLKQKLLQERCG